MLVDLPALILFLLPLTASPGPANLLLAAGGASFGARRTLPFLAGIMSVFAVQSLVVGAGLGELLGRYPGALGTLRFLGAGYLVYLAYRFFQANTVEEKNAGELGLLQGIVLQVLNFKALIVHVLLYTQFLDPAGPPWPQIIFLTTVLVVVGTASALVWLLGGQGLSKLLRTEKGGVWQGRLFGGMLLLVAAWMIFRR